MPITVAIVEDDAVRSEPHREIIASAPIRYRRGKHKHGPQSRRLLPPGCRLAGVLLQQADRPAEVSADHREFPHGCLKA